MSSTTFNEFMSETVLNGLTYDSKTIQVTELFNQVRTGRGMYIELSEDVSTPEPVLAVDGSIIYTEYGGYMNISATNRTDLLGLYDAVMTKLKSYAFRILGAQDTARRNRHERYLQITIKKVC